MKNINKNYGIILSIMLSIPWILVGCKFVRKVNVSEIEIKNENQGNEYSSTEVTENPVSIIVGDGNYIDKEALLVYFFGDTEASLKEEGYLCEEWTDTMSDCISFQCKKNGVELTYIYEYETNRNHFVLVDMLEDAGNRYEAVLEDRFIINELSSCLINMYPKGELESCSVEKAIEECAPIAEACGYSDAQVDVYVMKSDVLNNYLEETRITIPGIVFSAPDPNFDYNYVYELEDKIKAAKVTNDNDLLRSLRKEYVSYTMSDTKIEWTERNDAYLIAYRSYLNGRLLDSPIGYYCLICIYVPTYGKVVYATGDQSLVLTETCQEIQLFSKEEALEEALRVLKIQSTKDITITEISMVYAPRYLQVDPELEIRTIDPCWRIDYVLSEKLLLEQPALYYNDDGTIMINAVDGKENKFMMR